MTSTKLFVSKMSVAFPIVLTEVIFGIWFFKIYELGRKDQKITRRESMIL